jgi:hypothetical protein
MSDEIEYGICNVCGKYAPLLRTYYNYNVKCECHSSNHFEIIKHCRDCMPTQPEETWIKLKSKDLKIMAEALEEWYER